MLENSITGTLTALWFYLIYINLLLLNVGFENRLGLSMSVITFFIIIIFSPAFSVSD